MNKIDVQWLILGWAVKCLLQVKRSFSTGQRSATHHSTTAQNRTKNEWKRKRMEKKHIISEWCWWWWRWRWAGQHDNVVMGHGLCYSLSKSSLAYLFRLCQKINEMMAKDIGKWWIDEHEKTTYGEPTPPLEYVNVEKHAHTRLQACTMYAYTHAQTFILISAASMLWIRKSYPPASSAQIHHVTTSVFILYLVDIKWTVSLSILG